MNTIVVNNTNKTIQAYSYCMNSKLITLENIETAPTVIASYSAAYLPRACSGNTFIGIWDSTATKGHPDSWLVFDKTIVNSHFHNYTITIDPNDPLVIYVTPTTTATTTTIVIVITITIIILAILMAWGWASY